jgi:hypothetical protein
MNQGPEGGIEVYEEVMSEYAAKGKPVPGVR